MSATDEMIKANEGYARTFDCGDLLVSATLIRGLVYDVRNGRLREVPVEPPTTTP